MKHSLIFFLAMVLVASSCKTDSNKKLVGNWYYEGLQYDMVSEDSLWNYRYLEFTDSNTVYFTTGIKRLNKIYTDGYTIDWTYSYVRTDSLPVKFNFISDNSLELTYPDSTKQLFSRQNTSKRPNELFFHLLNLVGQNNFIRIDTMGDGTLFCNMDIAGNDKLNITAIEKQVKYFMDKHLGSLPQEEEEGKFSRWEKTLFNEYKWEDLNHKVTMENYFHFKDLEDEYTFNDEDELEIKIWLNVK